MQDARKYGYLCDKTRDTKADAASIRRTIKTLTNAGLLPADWKYSVRMARFSGGSSIDIYATSPAPIYAVDPAEYGAAIHPETGQQVSAWDDKLTVAAKAVYDALTDLHRGHNHDGSDTQSDHFDVKFYGSAHVDPAPRVPRYQPKA